MTDLPDGSFAALTAAIADDPETSAQVYGDTAQPEQPAEKYPAQITVFCDHCGAGATRDYIVSDDMTRSDRLAAARKHLTTNEGWQHDDDGDFCPEHAAGDTA